MKCILKIEIEFNQLTKEEEKEITLFKKSFSIIEKIFPKNLVFKILNWRISFLHWKPK